eukprot:c5109_g1_i1.p1 GENE.c5109_g1_i1~~c5109_g1_i1.p1  ORF type:complete len:212 (-),score=43.65 c5109_g1_i1:330-965(-)
MAAIIPTPRETRAVEDVIEHVIEVKGSAACVTELLRYGFDIILHSRRLIPEDKFQIISVGSWNIHTMADYGLANYLDDILRQTHCALCEELLSYITLNVVNSSTLEVSEKWMFQITLTSDSHPIHQPQNEIEEFFSQDRHVLLERTQQYYQQQYHLLQNFEIMVTNIRHQLVTTENTFFGVSNSSGGYESNVHHTFVIHGYTVLNTRLFPE